MWAWRALENQSYSKVLFILSPLSQIHVQEFLLRNLKRKPQQQSFKEGMRGKMSGLGMVQIQSGLWASWVLPGSALPWLASYPIPKPWVKTGSCQLQNYPKTRVLPRNLTNWLGSPAYFPHSHKAQTLFQFLSFLLSHQALAVLCSYIFFSFCFI